MAAPVARCAVSPMRWAAAAARRPTWRRPTWRPIWNPTRRPTSHQIRRQTCRKSGKRAAAAAATPAMTPLATARQFEWGRRPKHDDWQLCRTTPRASNGIDIEVSTSHGIGIKLSKYRLTTGRLTLNVVPGANRYVGFSTATLITSPRPSPPSSYNQQF